MSGVEMCDNKSVGVILTDESNRLLLLHRRKPPYGLAPPAGHVDGHGSALDAAITETLEETGLVIRPDELVHSIVDRRINNKCRREGGDHHIWNIYEGKFPMGTKFSASEDETLGLYIPTRIELQQIADNTRFVDQADISPGDILLEKIWLDMLVELNYVT